jgi:Tfp pilus assembly protein PilN
MSAGTGAYLVIVTCLGANFEAQANLVLVFSINKWNSSLGQNLSTSLFIGEITFAIVVGVLGLVLFGLLIGNMQVSQQQQRLKSYCLL